MSQVTFTSITLDDMEAKKFNVHDRTIYEASLEITVDNESRRVKVVVIPDRGVCAHFNDCAAHYWLLREDTFCKRDKVPQLTFESPKLIGEDGYCIDLAAHYQGRTAQPTGRPWLLYLAGAAATIGVGYFAYNWLRESRLRQAGAVVTLLIAYKLSGLVYALLTPARR